MNGQAPVSDTQRCGLCGRKAASAICDQCLATGVAPRVVHEELLHVTAVAGELDAHYPGAYEHGWEQWRRDVEPTSGGTHNDPTANIVVDVEHARMRAHTANAARYIKAMMAMADKAKQELEKALPREYQPIERQVPLCVSCARFGIEEPVHKAGRCAACYGYRQRNDGSDPPERLIRERQWARASRRHERARSA